MCRENAKTALRSFRVYVHVRGSNFRAGHRKSVAWAIQHVLNFTIFYSIMC